jgi:hypothetical protein
MYVRVEKLVSAKGRRSTIVAMHDDHAVSAERAVNTLLNHDSDWDTYAVDIEHIQEAHLSLAGY